MSGFPQAGRLLELLEQANGLAARVVELSGEQAKMLASDDLEAFNESLDSGQAIINKINGLHQESEVLMQSYASYSNSPGGGKIEAIEAAAREFVSLLEQCAGANSRNLGEAKEKAEEFIKQIGSLSMKRKSIGLYAQHGGGNSTLFDRKT